jgi:hypothetical protein
VTTTVVLDPPVEALAHALAKRGLIPEQSAYVSSRARVTERGRSHRHDLRQQVGARRWRAVAKALARPLAEDAMVRVLGFGDVLTRFSVAPLRLTEEDEDAVARLGARANLIVTIYDDLADRESGVEALSSHDLARLAGGGRSAMMGLVPRRGPSAFLIAAASSYFKDLAALPAARSRPRVVRTLIRAVARMHAAERASVHKGVSASPVALRRKAALPFVVMGMPGWLASADFDRRAYLWHLSWLFRLGSLLGRIDDVVDLADDLAAGRPNSVAARTEALAGSGSLDGIAELGRSVMDEWVRAMAPEGDDLPPEVRQAVPLCIASWLGGIEE